MSTVSSRKLKMARTTLRLLASGFAIFTLNPILNQHATRYLSRANPALSKKENSVSYLALFAVLFSSFYFVYPDDYAKYLDFLVPTLLVAITKVQSFQLVRAHKWLNSTVFRNLLKNLLVSVMVFEKAESFNALYLKLKALVAGKLLKRSLLLSTVFKSFNDNRYLVPLLGLLLSLNQNLLKMVFALVTGVNMVRHVNLQSLYRFSRAANNVSIVSLVFGANVLINNHSFYPAGLVDYSLRAVFSRTYNGEVAGRLRNNFSRYRKLQSFFLTLIIINLIKFTNERDFSDIDFKNYPLTKFQFKLLRSIKEGLLPTRKSPPSDSEDEGKDNGNDNALYTDSSPSQHHESPEKDHRRKSSVAARESNDYYFNDKRSRRGSRKSSSSGPIKLYDNDYSLQFESDSMEIIP